ncbi:MAG: hypothetical protein RLZZ399_1087 [Verrucomicrobiota bacterium]
MQPSLSTAHRPSLVEHVASALRERLGAGVWGKQLPGERELSQSLQVSRPTLRSALEILAKEGWFKAEQGRRRSILIPTAAPRRNAARVVALLSPLPLAELVPFAHVWTECLREFLGRHGYKLRIHVAGRWWQAENPERNLEILTEQQPATVWVLFSGSVRVQRWFGASPLICVTSGSEHTGVQLPSVDLHHRATCRHAAGRFLALGHQHIVLMRQKTASAGDLESQEGFLEAFRMHPDATPTVIEHDGTPEAIRRKLDYLLRGTRRPTGFLVTHAKPAILVASELIRRNLRIPRDVSVVCRDSDSFLAYFVPGIARYAVDSQFHAQRLGRLVLQYASGAVPRIQRVRLTPQFQPGESLAQRSPG